MGYHVAYVPGDVLADASGEPVPTAGAASLEIVVRAAASGDSPDRQSSPLLAHIGDDLFTVDDLRRWATFREIAFAGPSRARAPSPSGSTPSCLPRRLVRTRRAHLRVRRRRPAVVTPRTKVPHAADVLPWSAPVAGRIMDPVLNERDVVGLEEIATGDVTLVGGKAANLRRLVQAGFHVPGGFVVTSSAYLRAAEASRRTR